MNEDDHNTTPTSCKIITLPVRGSAIERRKRLLTQYLSCKLFLPEELILEEIEKN